MPRTKSFDEHKTLAKIGDLFWKNGYVATSMDQIGEHVNLKKTSLYNAYGDKGTLFRKVIDLYAADMLEAGRKSLKGDALPSEEIASLLQHLLIKPSPEDVSKGCLLATSLIELQHIEPALFEYAHAQTQRVHDLIDTYLENAVHRGYLSPNTDITALSQYYQIVVKGLRLKARTHTPSKKINDIISLSMAPFRQAELTA